MTTKQSKTAPSYGFFADLARILNSGQSRSVLIGGNVHDLYFVDGDFESESPESGEYHSLIQFLLGKNRYGIEVREVQEIQPLTDFTHIPCTPKFVVGVMNLRGNIMTLINLQEFLGIPQKGIQDVRKVIVLHSDVYLIGIVVRDVFDLLRVPRQNILPPIASEGGIDARYVRGLLSDLTVLINASAILDDPRMILNDEATDSHISPVEEA